MAEVECPMAARPKIKGVNLENPPLEWILTAPEAFALPASALQRAIARGADGLPPDDDTTLDYFGGTYPVSKPRLVAVIAGIRSGKSLMAGAAAWHASLSADLSPLRPNERARFCIVAPHKDNAENTFALLEASFSNKWLAPFVAAKGTNWVTIQRPDGHLVDIVVVAAHKGALSLRGTWLTGFCLEECAFFGEDEKGYKVNAADLVKGAYPRLLKNGQGWLISSPLGREGLLYDMYNQYFGIPGRVLVVKAPTLAMNPAFDRDEYAALKATDPDLAAREFEAKFVDTAQALLSSEDVDTSMLPSQGAHPNANHYYIATMDPATRGNAWSLAIATSDDAEHKSVVAVHEWIGSKQDPLSPAAVLGEVAQILKPYRVNSVLTDQYAADALRDIARPFGLTLNDIAVNQKIKYQMFLSLSVWLREHRLTLPPDKRLRKDLLAVRKVTTKDGAYIDLPKTPDGRHCDLAAAVALCFYDKPSAPDTPDKVVVPYSAEWHALAIAKDREAALVEAEARGRETVPDWVVPYLRDLDYD